MMHSDVVDTKEQIQSEHSGSSDDIVEEGKGRKTIENLRNSSSADCERETSQARVDAGSLDDKSIVKRAYDLIDRTAQKIRRSPATYHEEIDHYHVGAAHETELQAGPQGLAPVAARANAKAASAYFTGGRDKRREPSEPGAEYVRSRAPGLESTFYLRLFRNHNFVRTVSETERQHQPAETEETAESLSQIEALKRLNLKNIRCKRLRKCSWFLAIVAVCILVAVGTAIGIKVGKARQSKTQPTGRKGPTPSSPFTLDCNELKSQMQPNAMSQCNCTKEIIVVAPDIVERYNNLTESFIHTIFPLFDETLNSCNPQNQALVWLASDEGTTTDLRQRYTYALLFTLWNGPGWAKRDKWLSSDDECTWYGLDCNDQGEVINITFTSNNVLVDLPPVAALLSNVESLNIMLNNFQGNTIPTEVGLLSNLTTLVMDLTETKGTLPTELFELGATLQNFQATDNFLSGTIPTLIGKLTLLETLHLSGLGRLTGSIPAELGHCTNLVDITVGGNKLNGTIPNEFGSLVALETMDLSSNDLTGTIPSELGRCISLLLLDVSGNHLVGTVPTELAMLPLFGFLAIDGNKISVPPVVCQKFASHPQNCFGCIC